MRPPLRICYICKAVDESNPTVATQVRWIRALAAHPRVDRLLVLTRGAGPFELPSNVTVQTFGARGWPLTVVGFYRRLARLPWSDVDAFFVAQGGPYPALLLPVKAIMRRPVYQWKAHPFISRRMRFYARYCDDLIFTPTPGSFPMDLAKIRVVGHGIDTGLFRLAQVPQGPQSHDLAIVGRVAAVKHHHLAVEALAICRDRWGLTPTLDVVGPCAPKDEAYLERLTDLVEEHDLGGQVRFCGAVEHAELPSLLSRHQATMNLSDTAFDKAAGESMALGVPVITTNACTAEVLPDDLRPLFVVDQDAESVAAAIRDILAWDDATRDRMGRRLHDVIATHHDLDLLFDKIIEAIDADQGPRR